MLVLSKPAASSPAGSFGSRPLGTKNVLKLAREPVLRGVMMLVAVSASRCGLRLFVLVRCKRFSLSRLTKRVGPYGC